ncbi:MAG TPA: hypothetical protein VGI39_35000 [Polyangiaceae bacterium]|jgi:hypothetical protein
MGILSDFVVADRSEAAAVADAVRRDRWPSLQSKGFTLLELGLLHFALTGTDPDVPVSPPEFVKNPFTKTEMPVTVGTAYLDEFTCLQDRGESWVHEVPGPLVAELGNAASLKEAATRWARNEELRGASTADLEVVLVQLQRLARLALEQKKSLLLWTSL